jgi:predicted glycosyltransferase
MIRVLFDVVHPADVHFFKNTISSLKARGDRVLVTSRRKDITLQLLDKYDIPHQKISNQGDNPAELFVELIKRDYSLWRIARGFRPDVFVSNNSPSGAHIAWLLGKPSIVFDDTEIHRFNQRLYYPFVTEVHSPDCYLTSLGRKQRLFRGYHSMAYLHPDHFSASPEILRRAGLDSEERKVLVRFVSWGAMHDVGLSHFSPEQKRKLISTVSDFARVLISAEDRLDSDLEPYRLKLPDQHVHHLLANVDLVIGESATMCAEAATVGTPAVFIDEKGRGYTDELDSKYGLAFNFKSDEFERCEAQIKQLLSIDNIRGEFASNHARLMRDKINVADYQLAQIDRLAEVSNSGSAQ